MIKSNITHSTPSMVDGRHEIWYCRSPASSRYYGPLFILFFNKFVCIFPKYLYLYDMISPPPTHITCPYQHNIVCMRLVCLVNNFDWFCKRFDWVQKVTSNSIIISFFVVCYTFSWLIRAMKCSWNGYFCFLLF